MKSLDQRIQANVKYWSDRLIKGHNEAVYPSSEELQNLALAKCYSPGTIIKLGLIWQSKDQVYGGERGLTKYLSRVVTNCLNDYLRNEIPHHEKVVYLDSTIIDEDGEETSHHEFLSDELPEYQQFIMTDLRDELNPGEFELVVDYVIKDATIEELAKDSGTSISGKRRQLEAVKDKVKSKLGKLIGGRMRYAVPVSKRTNLRPDRIPEEVLKNWNTGARQVQVYTTCGHALPESYVSPPYQRWDMQNLISPGAAPNAGKWAQCERCWGHYWPELARQTTRRILMQQEAVEYGAYLIDLATEGLAGPNEAKTIENT